MERAFTVIGALSALLAVGAGAFGAHGLRGRLPHESLAVFEVAVRYQTYHALAIVLVAWAVGRWPSRSVTAAGWLFVAGTLCFSGSLYVLVLTGQRWLGAVTPLGGLLLMAAWGCLAWGALRGGGAPPRR